MRGWVTFAFLAGIPAIVACESVIGANFERNPRSDGGSVDETVPRDPDSAKDDAGETPPANVDLTSSEHCGARGHDCFGGECSAGICKPVSVARDLTMPVDLGLLGDYVYFVEQGTGVPDGRLSRVRRDSCKAAGSCNAPHVLVTDLKAPSGLALSPTDAFITRGTSLGQVLRFALGEADGTRVFADTETFPTRAVFVPAAGFDRVVWLRSGGGGGLRAKATTNSETAVSLLTERLNPADIAARGDKICWSESGNSELDGDGRVYCADMTGENEITVADRQAFPRGVAIDATHVYWANRGDGTLHRRRLDLSGKTEELQTGLDSPSSIGVDGDRIVWLESGSAPDYTNGRIRTSDKNGRNVRTLAESEPWPTRLVLDRKVAYFTTRGTLGKAFKDGEIRRVAF